MNYGFQDQATTTGDQDARSWMDGSGWTVSTGRDTRASGGDRTQASDGFGQAYSAAPSSSNGSILGMKPIELAMAAGLVLVLIVALKKRKG